jgi:hypothetical protein
MIWKLNVAEGSGPNQPGASLLTPSLLQQPDMTRYVFLFSQLLPETKDVQGGV